LGTPFDLVNGVLITAFFLISAVRNIAPPAENHSLFARILPLLALLPAPFAEAIGLHELAVRQLYIAAGFIAFVLMFELAAGRMPMATHWRDWYRRGLLSRTLGRMAMPGWPSALLYGVVLAILWAAIALIVLSGLSPASRDHAVRVAWLALLALSGLAFPAVVGSFVRSTAVPRPLL
jgi:hypothetical protein